MAFHLSVKSDLDRLDRQLHKHEQALKTKAVPQALNRVVRTVNAKAVRQVSGVTGIKQKEIRQKVRVIKAHRKRWYAAIDARAGKAENLIKFVRAAQQTVHTFRQRTKKGAFKHAGVKARAWGKLKTYESTFIGKGAAGRLKVLKRKTEARNDLQDVMGPSIREEFQRDSTVRMMQSIARQRFRIELSRSISNQIRRQI